MNIYPNPANDVVNIPYEGLEANDGQIALLDVTGKTLSQVAIQQKEDNITFDVTNFSDGFYYIRVTSGNRNTTRKLVLLK